MDSDEESRVAFLERAFKAEAELQERRPWAGCVQALFMRADKCHVCRRKYGFIRPETRQEFRDRVYAAALKRNYTSACGGCDLALDMRVDECRLCLAKYGRPDPREIKVELGGRGE